MIKQFTPNEGKWQEVDEGKEGKDKPRETEKPSIMDRMKSMFGKKEGKEEDSGKESSRDNHKDTEKQSNAMDKYKVDTPLDKQAEAAKEYREKHNLDTNGNPLPGSKRSEGGAERERDDDDPRESRYKPENEEKDSSDNSNDSSDNTTDSPEDD